MAIKNYFCFVEVDIFLANSLHGPLPFLFETFLSDFNFSAFDKKSSGLLIHNENKTGFSWTYFYLVFLYKCNVEVSMINGHNKCLYPFFVLDEKNQWNLQWLMWQHIICMRDLNKHRGSFNNPFTVASSDGSTMARIKQINS